jgi:hypothetical protein
MTNAHFKGHLMLLAEMTNKDLSAPLVQYWWQTFGNLPDATLLPAFEMAKQSCRFFPSPAEFHDLLRQAAAATGAVVDGATAWDECERLIFRQCSEAGDRLVLQSGQGYPWPNPRCKELVREQLNLTVRGIATMHAKDYDATKARFVALYDSVQAVERAEQAIDAPNVRRLPQQAGD